MRQDPSGAELQPADGYAPLSDVLGQTHTLTATEKKLLLTLRSALERHIVPHLESAWDEGNLPDSFIEDLENLNLIDPPELKESGEHVRPLFTAFRTFELARCDINIATLYNAHAGLFRTACLEGGDEEQRDYWKPRIDQHSIRGVFALTEPDHGSDIAGGLATSATQGADGSWVINGAKRWIGGAGTADYLCTFARDTADGQVKAFLVPTSAHGVSIEILPAKSSLRIMQNAEIHYQDVCVEPDARLRCINSFKDVARCLRLMRSDVAWIATGASAGAYEAAVAYVRERQQFGKSLGSFQLTQYKLAEMLSLVSSSLALCMAVTERQSHGIYRDEDSALLKLTTARNLRRIVALAREVCGGNGILLSNAVSRFHADAEAVYSYEGTDDINALIVGRSITGKSAFV
ncbi:acyl-CoA dehydrogenase family protein [Corynebacterium uropygiale]|uniref:Acyl-CoA dehydrogenase family protein n=1 Tax=Corynebacterium uropygiale TaxID=1775911 RepID=A0A9X1QQW8_9CORY|nr:acyl-CoA dehydrogenase family protein [Corynebacterium uropygiale]MCF4007481.1 acyl-CoA dehydrogenase family protein [Corynebacterium uropygiale]